MAQRLCSSDVSSLILRCLAAFLAGVNQLSWPRFLVANAAGAIVWATIFGLGAYVFGRQFTHVIGPLSLAAFALGAIVVIAGVSLPVAPRSSLGGGGGAGVARPSSAAYAGTTQSVNRRAKLCDDLQHPALVAPVDRHRGLRRALHHLS